MLSNIMNVFLTAFGQFNIGIMDSKDGVQIQVSFLSFFAYLIIFILFIVIMVKKKNRYRNLYEATKLEDKKRKK
jgi:hypothetical protein